MRKLVPTSRVSRLSSIVAAALWLFCAPKPAQAQGHISETEPERLLQIHQDLLSCAQSLGRTSETQEQYRRSGKRRLSRINNFSVSRRSHVISQ